MALSPAAQQQLARLWHAGLTASAIAAQLGVTKGVVTGNVWRMGLPARPSPIRRAAVGDVPAATRPAPRLHPASVLRLSGDVAMPAMRVRSRGPTPAARALRAATASAPRVSATRTCQWPLWPHGERAPTPPRFCGAPARMKRDRDGNAVPCSYCAAHAKAAFVVTSFGYATPGQLDKLAKSAV